MAGDGNIMPQTIENDSKIIRLILKYVLAFDTILTSEGELWQNKWTNRFQERRACNDVRYNKNNNNNNNDNNNNNITTTTNNNNNNNTIFNNLPITAELDMTIIASNSKLRQTMIDIQLEKKSRNWRCIRQSYLVMINYYKIYKMKEERK